MTLKWAEARDSFFLRDRTAGAVAVDLLPWQRVDVMGEKRNYVYLGTTHTHLALADNWYTCLSNALNK